MATFSSTALSLPDAPADNRFRVLLLEDDAALAETMLSVLSRTGFTCRVASDSEAGMTAFIEIVPHLLVAQAQSPSVDGHAFCRWVRERNGIPIILLGPANEAAEIAALKIGADDYIPAPPRPATLLARVVAQLRRAYRYNAPAKPDNPFGLPVEDEQGAPSLPRGWVACELCGYAGPRLRFEKDDWRGNIKMICPNCKSSEHIIISLD